MQEQHWNELSEELAGSIPKMKSQMRPLVQERLRRLEEENKLFKLPPDEFAMLLAYRNWKASSDAVTGVFHYRRRDLDIPKEPEKATSQLDSEGGGE